MGIIPVFVYASDCNKLQQGVSVYELGGTFRKVCEQKHVFSYLWSFFEY